MRLYDYTDECAYTYIYIASTPRPHGGGEGLPCYSRISASPRVEPRSQRVRVEDADLQELGGHSVNCSCLGYRRSGLWFGAL